ncbi:MAG: N-6 DNA methylase [Firmicutes bacterium]|nr:N-6 DNA methylase [Bacillota bacterium]MCL5993042.1 N-6 DNA methylase [Bacillota bacterium]
MPVDPIIRRYLRSFQQEYRDALAGGQHTTELSFRPPLHTMFQELAAELNGSPDIVVVLEPRNQACMGRPDWRFHDRNTLGVYGYIEAKGYSPDAFDITPHEEQFNRYLALGHKLIITDGVDFVYSFDDGEPPHVISLIDKMNMNRPDWSRLTINPQFEVMMCRFFAEPSPQYCDEGGLVKLVALRTRFLSDEILRYAGIPIDEAMNDTESGAISLLGDLRELVYNHNDPTLRQDRVFADFAAQVIMFTLLYAHRVECADADSSTEKERKIREYLAREIEDGQALRPFLTIIHYINSHGNDSNFILTWTDECIRFLSFVHMTEQQRQRPDYHKLFELFLSKFDPRSRFDYGAYYTPSELADCIVRLVEVIARDSFNGASIFADGNTLIDPCCGTGSFLERIRQNDVRHGAYTLCGIEILPAPYMLANYRMAALNHEIEGGRFHNELILANALSDVVFGEPANTDTIEGFELNRAREISSRPITLVIGNPPSSDSSKTNIGVDFSRILALMDDFRPPAANRHARQNTQKQINNPHLQFLRWGCEKLRLSENHSILAYIVPSTFLEAESYRFARKYIVENFSSAWIVSVDADARAGIRSDSMFKTLQGRAILIAARRFGEPAGIAEYLYYDISRLSKAEKAAWLEQDAEASLRAFTLHAVDAVNYSLRPSLPFNEKLYVSYWPVSGEAEPNAIFKNHCSGVKLAPSSLFTHLKTPMLKRRSRDIMQRGVPATDEWLGAQDKPPKEVETSAFARELNAHGNVAAVDALLDANIVDYAFRPFLPMKAFLWQELLHKFASVGGGGTRRRPEISTAYSNEGTVGFALSHSPKDQKDVLKQFASFCWYYPDNDLCRRGNSFIYLNRHSVKRRGGGYDIVNNINDRICCELTALLGIGDDAVATDMIFYTFAVLCSQVYLDEFEGALFITNRTDLRPRIPIVSDAAVFRRLVSLGRQIADLERSDHNPANLAEYDYDEIKAQVPPNFQLVWTKAIQPFDEEQETITLTDGRRNIVIRCPLDAQRINIAGYEVIKNVWMKFNSYDYTHCPFTPDDMEGLLILINKLLKYVALVGEIDVIMHEVIEGHYLLIRPLVGTDAE